MTNNTKETFLQMFPRYYMYGDALFEFSTTHYHLHTLPSRHITISTHYHLSFCFLDEPVEKTEQMLKLEKTSGLLQELEQTQFKRLSASVTSLRAAAEPNQQENQLGKFIRHLFNKVNLISLFCVFLWLQIIIFLLRSDLYQM